MGRNFDHSYGNAQKSIGLDAKAGEKQEDNVIVMLCINGIASEKGTSGRHRKMSILNSHSLPNCWNPHQNG